MIESRNVFVLPVGRPISKSWWIERYELSYTCDLALNSPLRISATDSECNPLGYLELTCDPKLKHIFSIFSNYSFIKYLIELNLFETKAISTYNISC